MLSRSICRNFSSSTLGVNWTVAGGSALRMAVAARSVKPVRSASGRSPPPPESPPSARRCGVALDACPRLRLAVLVGVSAPPPTPPPPPLRPLLPLPLAPTPPPPPTPPSQA